MVYVYMDNYEYNHDIFELIRSFYPNRELENIKDLKEYSSGLLVYVKVYESEGDLTCKCELSMDNVLISKNVENLEEVSIKRSRERSINIGVKKSIYKALIKASDSTHPWGVLTGIRPTKIVHYLIEKNTKSEEIADILSKQYLLDDDKVNLLMETTERQKRFLHPRDSSKFSLYINIPFCPTKCIYCSFPTMSIKRQGYLVDTYVEHLIYEIRMIKELTKDKSVNTVYIGGGTPTAIPVDSLKSIIEEVFICFGEANIKEFTVEAGRPDTLTIDMLKMLKEMNVKRISINPQTMNNTTLKTIGRNHSFQDIIDSYREAQEIGFEVINMDLIVGLPGEGLEEINKTLKTIGDLSPENLTVHTLALKSGSVFKEQISEYNLENQRVIENMLDTVRAFAKENGYFPYYLYRQKNILGNFENIGYAKKDKECIYNISIMEEKETVIGAGVGATTKVYNPSNNKLKRSFNFRDINEYIKRFDEIIDKKRNVIL